MKLPIRFLSIPLVVITMTGMSACKDTTDAPPDKSLLTTGAAVDARLIQGTVTDWTKAVALDQESSKGFAAQGSVKYALGDQKGAIEDFTRAIVLDPKSVAAYSGRATARYTTGDISGAIADGLEAAKLMVLSKIGNGNNAAE
ncbi:MAG: tetratricopeptide repeat protein [Chlorobiaceae bacterium]|nr:tetratricopeptide repeat protein [Chlorobiaceae bacterium]